MLQQNHPLSRAVLMAPGRQAGEVLHQEAVSDITGGGLCGDLGQR